MPYSLIFFFPGRASNLDVYIEKLILKSQHSFLFNITLYRLDKICVWLNQTLEPPVCSFIAGLQLNGRQGINPSPQAILTHLLF